MPPRSEAADRRAGDRANAVVLERATLVRLCEIPTMSHLVRRLLAWGVLLTLLLPMVIAVVLGLGSLLSSLGDDAGAAACGRVGLVVGVVWFLALAGTSAASGILALEGNDSRTDRPDRPAE